MTQRWRDGRDSYRPRGEPVDPREWEVAEIRHPGNHRYVWAIDQGAGRLARRGAARALERHLAARRVRTDLARPKEIDLAA